MIHTVPIHENDRLVIVTRDGEELHLDSTTLVSLIDEAYMGLESSEDLARDDNDSDALAKLDALAAVLEWMGVKGGVSSEEDGFEADRDRRTMSSCTGQPLAP